VEVLKGIKVIDISQVIAVPIAARNLADFGADVIHIEHPKRGDLWRSYLSDVGGTGSVPSDINYVWETYNRNKKSLTLDLSTETGREIVHKLVEQADVLVTNLRIWEREKFKLDYETLRKINPKLIYGSITGLGKEGPEKNSPAYDQTVHWYRSGVTYVLTPPGASGIGFRAGFGDTVAGMSLFAGVVTALYAREKTGIGQEVELSLFSTGIYQLSHDVAGALATGTDFREMFSTLFDENDPRLQKLTELWSESLKAFDRVSDFFKENVPNPLAMAYKTKDERIVFLNILTPDSYWTKICRALGKPELENDPRFTAHEVRLENHLDLYHIVKDTIGNMMLEEIKPRLTEAGIPYAVQQKMSEVVNDPQAIANNYFPEFEHPTYGKIRVIANPINLSETPSTLRLPAPEFSQHTEETLLELGYTWEDIVKFKEQGVIA